MRIELTASIVYQDTVSRRRGGANPVRRGNSSASFYVTELPVRESAVGNEEEIEL